MTEQHYFAKGKLLLSGEYFVLDGTKALAIPTKYGQSLRLSALNKSKNTFRFESYTVDQERWFSGLFDASTFAVLSSNNQEVAERLVQIFQAILVQKPETKKKLSGLSFSTYLDFPNNWGLGSSSTLLHLLSQWSGANPFQLLEDSFGGSGYDIACAGAESAIFYQRINGKPTVEAVDFSPAFAKNIYFVHLGKKQNSRLGIQHYRSQKNLSQSLYKDLSNIGIAMAKCRDRSHFIDLMSQHEVIISQSLSLEKVKDLYFSDFPGAIKSLGAWGGDFVMALAEKEAFLTKEYFENKGFKTCLSFEEMIGETKGKARDK